MMVLAEEEALRKLIREEMKAALEEPRVAAVDPNEELSPEEVGKLIHLSKWAVYKMIKSGKLRVIRRGSRIFIRRADLGSV